MSASDKSLGERVANIEGTVSQMDLRLTRIESRLASVDERVDTRTTTLDQKIDTRFAALDEKIDQTRRDIRNWLVFTVVTTSLITTLAIGLLQLAV